MARILIIDDDDLLRGVITKALGHAGHTVFQAADGRQGIDLFQATPIDLVITDLVMPVQEGVETILKLRRKHPKLPIIAISGGVNNSNLYLEIAGKMGAQRKWRPISAGHLCSSSSVNYHAAPSNPTRALPNDRGEARIRKPSVRQRRQAL